MNLMFFYKTLELLESSKELKRTGVGAAKQTAVTGGATLAGCLLAGPLGGLVGAAIGGAIGYFTADDYKALLNVIKAMTDEEKAKVQRKLQEIVGSCSLDALATFMQNEVNHQIIWQCFKQVTQ